MSDKTTLETLKEVIVDQLGADADTVTQEAHIISDLGADSLDQVELIMAIEEEFEIEIQDEEAEKALVVKDIVELIDSKK